MCGSSATDDAAICFECLYSFELMSCVAMPSGEPSEAQEQPAIALLQDAELPIVDLGAPSDFVIVVDDEEFGRRQFSFDGGSVYVGRLPTNDIVLNDRTVSRRHVHIFYEQGAVWVEDFGSPNPATLNGVRLSGRALLTPSDHLAVRGATIVLSRVGE